MAGLIRKVRQRSLGRQSLGRRLTGQPLTLRRWLYLAIATALAIGLLHWSFRDLQWTEVWMALRQAKVGWLVFGLSAYLLSCGLRAWRWGILLRAQHSAGTLRQRTAAIFVGYAGNSFLPFSAGEVIRAGLLQRLAQVPAQAALGSIVAERLLDIWVVFLLLVLCVNQTLGQSGAISLPLGWMTFFVGLVSAGIWLAARYPRAIARGLSQQAQKFLAPLGLNRFCQALESSLIDFLQGLQTFQQPGRFLTALTASLAIWLMNGLLYWATLNALSISGPGFSGALLAQSLTAFAMVLPASPGYIGPFEAAIRVALDWFAVNGALAVAYALVLRILMYLITPMVGLAIALKLGISGPNSAENQLKEVDRNAPKQSLL